MTNFEKNLKYIHKMLETTDDLTLYKTKLSKEDIRYLQAKGLLVKDSKLEYMDGDICLVLTPKGITYFEDKKEKFKDKIIWSILTPISLSIITTLITIWIKGLFN